MRWLPKIEYAGGQWHLPLSDHAASYLAWRCIQRGATPCHGRVRQALFGGYWKRRKITRLLLCDPAFTLWCLWQQHWYGETACSKDHGKLARWLASVPVEGWLRTLPLSDVPADARRDSSTSAPWRSLAKVALGRCLPYLGKERYRHDHVFGAHLDDAHRWFGARDNDLFALPLSPSLRRSMTKYRNSRHRALPSQSLPVALRRAIKSTWSKKDDRWRLTLAWMLGHERSDAGGLIVPDREKLAALAQLAYGASHEINNPLANIATRAQTLARRTEDPELQRHLQAINAQAFRAHEMIADLMLFAKPPKLQLSIFDLGQLVREAVAQTHRDVKSEQQHAIEIMMDLRPVLVEADATQLTVVVKALLRNSVEALRDGGRIWLKLTQSASNGRSGEACLTIRDSGPGLDDHARRHLFDPFFSGRESGRGLGFGLTKAWTIVNQHQGKIIAKTPAAGGAEIQVVLACDR